MTQATINVPESKHEDTRRLDRRSRRRAGYALLSISAVIVAVLAAILLACGYLEAWHVPYFEQRYAPTMAIAHGTPIYQIQITGPVFCSIYGPLSYLAFIPAALLPTVQGVFAAGSLTATLFLFAPIAFAILAYVRKGWLSKSAVVPILLVPVAAISALRSLSYTASNVTADAPAICFVALAALLLFRHSQNPTWMASILGCFSLVIGIGCKQNMLFAGLVIVAGVFGTFTRRFAYTFLATLVAVSLLVLGFVAILYHGLAAIFYNDVFIPAHMPFLPANLFQGAYRWFESSILLILLLTAIVLILFVAQTSSAWRALPRVSLVFFSMAVVLAPLSIRIYAVGGGDINDFSHTVYFLLLGVVITAIEISSRLQDQERPSIALRTILVTGSLAFFGLGLPTRYTADWKAIMRHTPSAFQAFTYTRNHPDQVYFPSNTIGVYMAERRFYHTDWGIMIRRQARQDITKKEFFQHIPATARYVAVPGDYGHGHDVAALDYAAPHLKAATVPGLESFAVFVLER